AGAGGAAGGAAGGVAAGGVADRATERRVGSGGAWPTAGDERSARPSGNRSSPIRPDQADPDSRPLLAVGASRSSADWAGGRPAIVSPPCRSRPAGRLAAAISACWPPVG